MMRPPPTPVPTKMPSTFRGAPGRAVGELAVGPHSNVVFDDHRPHPGRGHERLEIDIPPVEVRGESDTRGTGRSGPGRRYPCREPGEGSTFASFNTASTP